MCMSHGFAAPVSLSRRRGTVPFRSLLGLVLAFGVGRDALAGSNTWYVGATSGSWPVTSSWGSGLLNTIVPGATSGTTNTDTATFDSGSFVTEIVPDANRNLENITFDINAAAYTIGTTSGNALVMTSFGTIQIASTFSSSSINETINAPLTLEGDYTLADNGANAGVSLAFGGAISAADQGGSILTVAGAGNTVISGAIGGIKTIDLVKSGSGTLTLSGNNTFTGGVTIDAGTLQISSAGALNSASPNAVAFGPGSTGTLVLNVSAITVSGLTTNATVGSPVISPGPGLSASSILTVNNASDDTYGGVLKDGTNGFSPLALIKSGAGTLTLSGNNSFSGGTTINAGNLTIGNSAALNEPDGQNTVKFGPGTTGTLSLNGHSIIIFNLLTSSPLGSPVIQNASSTAATLTIGNSSVGSTPGGGTYAGVLQDGLGGGALALDLSAADLTLAGDNTFTGGVTINGGSLLLANPGALNSSSPNAVTLTRGFLVLGGNNTTISGLNTVATPGACTVTNGSSTPATLTVNNAGANTYGGVLEDEGSAALSLIKSDAGTLTLSGPNTYTGFTSIIGGTLRGGAANTFSSASAVTVGSGATFDLGGFTQSISSLAGAGLVTTEGAAGSDMLTVGSDNTSTSFSGLISNAAGGRTLALTKLGTGMLTLSGNNSFTGGATINAGTLQLANSGALNLTTPNAVAFGSGSTGTLDLNGNSITVPGLNTNATTGSPLVQNASAVAATLTINNAGSDTYGGVLQDGSGGGILTLVKTGAGPLTLGGNNGFTGGVTIDAGTLQLANPGPQLEHAKQRHVWFGQYRDPELERQQHHRCRPQYECDNRFADGPRRQCNTGDPHHQHCSELEHLPRRRAGWAWWWRADPDQDRRRR